MWRKIVVLESQYYVNSKYCLEMFDFFTISQGFILLPYAHSEWKP